MEHYTRNTVSVSPFALEPTGPQVPCDFPECTLHAFHDGDHLFAQRPAPPQNRAHYFECAICKRQMVRYSVLPHEVDLCDSQECLQAWCARQKSTPHFVCTCPQRSYAHELSVHQNLKAESYNPGRRFEWPWSLMLSERVEPSTEKLNG